MGGGDSLSRTETSDLLRDTCQTLSELCTDLERVWDKVHPGRPQPRWSVEAIPEEELARIGWDFHSNRVQILDTGGSLWQALVCLLQGDQQSSFAKPPTAKEASEALSRAASRLSSDARSVSRLGGT